MLNLCIRNTGRVCLCGFPNPVHKHDNKSLDQGIVCFSQVPRNCTERIVLMRFHCLICAVVGPVFWVVLNPRIFRPGPDKVEYVINQVKFSNII